MNKQRALLAAAVVAASSTVPASAEVSHYTFAHANMCMPATNDLTRTTYGIRNNTTGNRSVYCGFESRDYLTPGYEFVVVGLRNYAGVERAVTCYWTSGQPYGGGYASATATITLPADGGLVHAASASELARPSIYATLGLRCALPPGVAMDLIEVYAEPEPAAG